MAQATTDSPLTSVRHPLAPLTADEAGQASRLALAAAGPGTRLVYCALAEPAKREVLAWDGRPLPRQARCVLYERPAGQTWVITVSLDKAEVVRKVLVPDVQPPLMAEEWMADSERIKADPGFRAALARRGITDMSLVQVDPWPASNFGLEIDASGRRLARGVAYLLDGPGSNPYARPVENLVAVADRDTGEIAGDRGWRGGAGSPGPRPVRHGQRRRTPPPVGAADPAARRARVQRGRRVPDLGTLADAGLAAPDRGAGPAPDRLPRPGAAAAHHLPGQPVRDGRAVRLHRDEPLVEERLRRRRRRPGQDGQPAGTRLRVPGRDRLPGRGRRRRGRRGQRPAPGHLPARRGLRGALDAP